MVNDNKKPITKVRMHVEAQLEQHRKPERHRDLARATTTGQQHEEGARVLRDRDTEQGEADGQPSEQEMSKERLGPV